MVLPPESRVRLLGELDLRDNPQDPVRSTAAYGSKLIVAGGPRDFEGGTWYQVVDADGMPGWVRVDRPSAVETVPGDCPDSYQGAMVLLAWDRVVCFGQVPGYTYGIIVTGQLSHCQGGIVEAEPEWLAHSCWVVSDLAGGSIDLHAAPDSGIAFPDTPEGETVRAQITGHVDDAAAATCLFHSELYADTPWLAPGPDEQILLCREAFVVDALEILQ